MPRVIRVAAAQTGSVENEDMATMTPKACEFVEAAAKQGVNLLVFPELFLSPFFPNRLEENFDRFFTRQDGEVLRPIREAARAAGIAIVLPFGEWTPGGMFNSALVADSQGRVQGVYRKTHIPAYFPNAKVGGTGSYEKFYFTPGGELPVFDVDGVKIGVQICNDRLYPEGSRVLALGGAEIIAMPIAYSVYSDPEYREAIWDLAIRARAFENGVFVVATNKVGMEGVRRHLGRSMVVNPRGMTLAEASSEKEELLVHEIDLDAVALSRKKFPWWRDRRPELYGPIAESAR